MTNFVVSSIRKISANQKMPWYDTCYIISCCIFSLNIVTYCLKIFVKFCRVCVECKSWEATICLLLNENKFSLWYTNTLAHKERKNKESFVIKFHFKFVSQTLLVLHTEYLIMEPLFWGSHQLKSMDEKKKVIKYLIIHGGI